ncbi:MAG: hypothetical protein A2015_03915 [Spirochaetes bacterium GWF1_31_7]|nr:MAG: hypothetical protein A2Y29_00720 [Spirochaetes bacterium GWE2_31_10]OHD51341.1 MAG: hypothetical protein A2015_03915 [Spirochaetes bacterium GWF1_31_7]OHD78084.1 MAG: hypothetical protein A2355_11880 [Spirochaetes bacterium RIFOXYB1_FULL_32_8]HBD96401.1 peptidoglycan glycosyltransferase [Spirochaetia bacterium]HBI39226.1 peptidoglycan glycosyltransferase [Spirochaetia bacterium]
MAKLKFIFKKRYLIIIIPFLIILFLHLLLLILPYSDLDNFLNRQYSLEIIDRNGNLIYITALDNGDRREFVSIDNLPKNVIDIFLKCEDKRFFYHPGIDIFALIRSFYMNFTSNSTISGASTITMQLSRIISPHKSGYQGKITEVVNALRLESKLSKKRILELWLNSLPYGFRAVGIKSASKTFFCKNISLLTESQVVSLAIIPRNPNEYNPLTSQKKAIGKVKSVLKSINIVENESKIENEISQAVTISYENRNPHFIEYIKNEITDDEYKTGSPIYTSLNLDLTYYIQNILKQNLENLKDFRITNGSVIVYNNQNGEILVYIGSKDFDDIENSGEIDGIHVKNQPGSTIKAFLYADAIEKGFLPSSILPDIPMDFGSSEIYVPLNFNRRFNGPVRLRVALASSLNIPSIYLVTRIGVQNFVETLKKLDFESLNGQEANIGSGIAVGNAEVSLFELTRAFAIFQRSGYKLKTSWHLLKNKTLYNTDKVFSDYTSFIISDILSDNKSRITGLGSNSILNTNFNAMFKTGTSNQFNDIWCLGATPEYTVGVWMGNFSGETVIGKTGSGIPASIAVKTLETLIENTGNKDFKRPDNIKKELICPLSGELITPLCSGGVYEYFNKNEIINSCSFHQKRAGEVYVEYPIEYSKWARDSGKIDILPGLSSNEDNLEIVKPKNNAVYYFDPSIPAENQAVRLEVLYTKPNEEIKLFVNGKYKESLKYPYEWFFPLNIGEWEIEVRSNYQNDKINIKVH